MYFLRACSDPVELCAWFGVRRHLAVLAALCSAPCSAAADASSASAAFRLLSASIRKLARDHHLLAFAHALQHLDIVVAARAQLDLARLEEAFGQLHQHHWRVPLSITAEAGTVSTLPWPVAASSSWRTGRA